MIERDVSVRPATTAELPAVMNVLDGALLETDASAVADHVGRGNVLVAVDDGSVLGACVLDPTEGAHVEAIAVRLRCRDRGIGRALLVSAADRHGRLTADFDDSVRGFYESLGFAVEPNGERYRGEWQP